MKHKLLSILLCLAMALSLLPTAALAEETTENSVKIGETAGYETLDAAITAAGDDDTITILKPAKEESGYKLNGNLTYSDKAITIKAADGVDVKFDMSAAVALHGAKITFEGVTFEYGTENYIGLQHTSQLTYNHCIINGKVFLYAEDEIFNECVFNAKKNSEDEADYNVWTYGAKNVTFNKCTFNCDGKAVLVYNEGSISKTDLKVTNTTFAASASVEGKAAIEIDTSLMKGQTKITVDQATAAQTTGFDTGSNSGSSLWNDKKQNTDSNKNTTVVVAGTTVFAPPAVAEVGSKKFTSLAEAFEALKETNHTLTLIDDSAWDAANPVYWKAGSQDGYAATLTAALTAAYKANKGDITIVCRPSADVGTMTHGHVADNLTIYGNDAFISGGECDLEVDTYQFSRKTGAQANDGAYLDKNITITAYELDNLGVWGERNTNHNVNVVLTDCDGNDKVVPNVQRVYISGTTGKNNITLIGCDFRTKATAVYSNADGDVTIKNCSFADSQVPVNINHKADGTQAVMVMNSYFTACGDDGEWKQFAAPIRFVNSGNGTMSANVSDCTFTGTKGTNGDILLGDGRTNKQSNNLELTVSGTAANVQAQKPGYYAANGAVAEAGNVSKTTVKKSAEATTITNKEEVFVVAKIGETPYTTLAAAVAAAEDGDIVKLLKDCSGDGIVVREGTFASKGLTVDFGGHTYTVGGVLVGSSGTKSNGFQLNKNNKITFRNGAIYGDASVAGDNETNWHGAPAMMLQNYCNLTLKNMTVTGGDETVYTMSNNHGDVVIEDSTITAGKAKGYSSGPYAFDVCGYDTYTGVSVTVKGNSTIIGDIEVSRSANNTNDVKLALESGTVNGELKIDRSIKPGDATAITKTENVSLTAPSGYTWTKVGNTEVLVNENSAAVVNGVGYATLAEAINAAGNDDTVTLLKDEELTSPLDLAKNITIDGQGKYTIKAANSFNVGGNNKTYCVLYVSGEVTLKDVTVNGNEKCRVIFCDKGKLTIDGATITNGKAPNFIGGVYMTSSASFEMKSGSITGNKNAERYQSEKYLQYSSDLWIGANANGALTAINGGTIGNVFVNANAWSANNPGSFTMNGGTVTNLYVEYDVDYGATFEYNDGTIEHLYLSKEYGNGQSIEVTPVKGVTYKGGVKEENLVTLTMKYNDGETADITYNVASGTTITLPTPAHRSGYTFNGWYDGSKFYAAGASYTVSATVTLNASWSYISSGSSSYDPTWVFR